MSQIKVSIIMPVYNCERFLAQTLDSIVNQSFHDYELIVVNDGSTDNSKKILEKYSSILPNMYIINQANMGVSVARNKGLAVAQGEYVCFVDADDWMHPDFLRIMMDVLQTSEADIAFCEYEPFYDVVQLDRGIVDVQSIRAIELWEKYREYTFDYIMQLGLGTALWNKVFRTDVLKKYQIHFDINLAFGEDMFFNWKVFLVSHNVYYVKKCLYGYRQNIEGATFKYHPNLYESYKQEYKNLLHFAKVNGVLNQQLNTSVKCNMAKRIPSFLRMNQRRKAFVSEKYIFVKELIQKADIYEAAEVLLKLYPKQNRMNRLLYRGILQHKTFQVFLYGCYAEYRFRIGRKINYWRKKGR